MHSAFESEMNGDVDRYGTEQDSSVGTLESGHVDAASALLNTIGESASSPPEASPRLSRNAVAASRLIRSRKDRRKNHIAVSGDHDQHSVASQDTLPTSPKRNPMLKIVTTGLPSHPVALSPSANASLQRDTMMVSPNSVASTQSGMASSASMRRSIRSRRERVAGGAAAKLVGPTSPQALDDAPESVKYEEALTAEQLRKLALTPQELDEVREKTRNEFVTGSQQNSRYRSESESEQETITDVLSEASVPSILNRSEVFHENATAAILALLTPRYTGFGEGSSVSESPAAKPDLQLSSINSGLIVESPPKTSPSAFRFSRQENDSEVVVSATSPNRNNSFRDGLPLSPSRMPKPLLSNIGERKLENIKGRMKDPNKQLSDLLVAIAAPEEGQHKDRGFMVRRKNACGALKVLTSNPANRRSICWTLGVLPALTSVLQDTGSDFDSVYTKHEYAEARTRAVAILLHLVVNKENRLPIFHSQGLVQALLRVIVDDKGEARQGCCGILVYLARTNENKLLMVQVPTMLDSILSVIKPIVHRPPDEEKKYHWDRDDEDSEGSDYEGRRNESMRSYGSDVDKYEEPNSPNSSHGDDEDYDSDSSPRRTSAQRPLRMTKAEKYDKEPNPFLHTSRQSIFATLLHLIKEKDNAFAIARHNDLVCTLVEIAELHASPSHEHAVKILAHLTRHRENSRLFVFRLRIIAPCFVLSTSSPSFEARKFACYALQNLSQDKACRQEVATTKGVVMAMCQRARQGSDPEEKQAAISTLKNLTDEPANLIPMTNTPECFATLMQIAHGGDEGITEMMQYLACDALATLSHWLRKIATSGDTISNPNRKRTGMFLPTLKTVTWSQWQ